MRSLLTLPTALVLIVTPDTVAAAPPDAAALRDMALAGDVFALREALSGGEPARGDAPVSERLARAAKDLAFGDPEGAAPVLEALAAEESIAPEERELALELAWNGFLRAHRYADARRAADALAREAPAGTDTVRRNRAAATLPLLAALGDTPPQTASRGGLDRLLLTRGGTVRAEVAGRDASLLIDTGANLSVLRRAEAERLGLEVREAAVRVGTAEGGAVRTAVTVAPTVRLGRTQLTQVPFLVLADRPGAGDGALPGGVLGLPVLEALGELRFRRDGVLEVGPDLPARGPANLAIVGLEPRVLLAYDDTDIVCRLDTGAETTVFFTPFYRAHEKRIESLGTPFTAETAGLGGSARVPAYRVPRLTITLARLGVPLRGVEVYTRPLGAGADPGLDCNLGWDALLSRGAWSVSFKEKALALE